jgi:hypothetical protein
MLETEDFFAEAGLIADKQEPQLLPLASYRHDSGHDSDFTRSRAYTNAQNIIVKLFTELQTAVDNRKMALLDELHRLYEQSLSVDTLVEGFQAEFGNVAELVKLINACGQVTVRHRPQPIDEHSFKITGRGLKGCTVNEETSFSLSLKSKQHVLEQLTNATSLLDIFIMNNSTGSETSISDSSTSTTTTTNPKPNPFQAKKRSLDISRQQATAIANKLNNSLVISSNTPEALAASKCNCDCRMECLSDGLYEVRYKLDKKGVYSLNVLVNKKHMHGSPFKLVCVESMTTTTSRNADGGDTLSRALNVTFSSQSKSRSFAMSARQPVKSHSSFNLKTLGSGNLLSNRYVFFLFKISNLEESLIKLLLCGNKIVEPFP